ncbi:MAG: hypothetical protein ACI9TI_002409, partial [Natronomonas sp.]
MPRRSTLAAVSGVFAWLLARPAAAHVDYVTEGDGEQIDPVAFTVEVLSDPFNAAVLFGS